jgi:micrococcal nuclease
MWRVASHLSVGVVGILVSLAAAGAATGYTPSALTGSVVYVDDGDTIDVTVGDRVERVRYIGVDAPEIAHEARGDRPARRGAPGGVAAARINAALVAGRSVRLELDVETRDRYGRLLAYVWVGHRMVNAALVARGYARAAPIPPNLRHAAWFATLESQARAARRGLWACDALRASSEGRGLKTLGIVAFERRLAGRSPVGAGALTTPPAPPRKAARSRGCRIDPCVS